MPSGTCRRRHEGDAAGAAVAGLCAEQDSADEAGQDGDKPEGEVIEEDRAEDVVSDNPVRFQLAETPQAACPSTTAKPVGDSDHLDGDDNTAAAKERTGTACR